MDYIGLGAMVMVVVLTATFIVWRIHSIAIGGPLL